jgi:long-chain acyl-CoA synthetase
VSAYRLVTAAESELAQRRVAGGLRAEGLRAGDRVAIVAGNAPDVIAVALGALRSGIVPVMVNAALTDGERSVIMEDCAPSLVLDDVGVAALARGPEVIELSTVPLARPMHYTSGTTGRPKGVWSGLLDDDRAAALLAEERSLWGFAADDVNLVCSPLYHSAPLRFAAGTLLAGGDVVVLDKFAPSAARAAIAEHRVTSAFMAPAHLQRLFEVGMRADEVSSFRLLAHAGAPCPAVVKERAVNAFPAGSVWEFYGSTEGQFTACSTADWQARPGSVGRARPGRSLSIDTESGTIWCNVPSYARFSYWGDDVKTAAAWRGDAFSVFDLGRLDDEGFLYLDGRRDDLIISGGVNVYPLEIEIALGRCTGVDEVAVFGMDDERWGQRVVAAVVGRADEASLRAFTEEALAPYKRPKAYVFVDEIPKTPTGKVRRSRLAADLGL